MARWGVFLSKRADFLVRYRTGAFNDELEKRPETG